MFKQITATKYTLNRVFDIILLEGWHNATNSFRVYFALNESLLLIPKNMIEIIAFEKYY